MPADDAVQAPGCNALVKRGMNCLFSPRLHFCNPCFEQRCVSDALLEAELPVLTPLQ